jgi:hypothetical protein
MITANGDAMPADKTARAAALEVLLAHFPNVSFLALGIENVYGAQIARELPAAMAALHAELERELCRVTSIGNTAHPEH